MQGTVFQSGAFILRRGHKASVLDTSVEGGGCSFRPADIPRHLVLDESMGCDRRVWNMCEGSKKAQVANVLAEGRLNLLESCEIINLKDDDYIMGWDLS